MSKCFQCRKNGKSLYGYMVCDSCKSKLRLFTDESIRRINESQDLAKEMNRRLEILDNDYIKKRIKILHILDRLKHIK